MLNKLPEKYKYSFLTKLKRAFLSVFGKKNIIIESKQIAQEKMVEIQPEKTVFDMMKEASSKAKLKEDILSIVKANQSLIDTLTIEQLKELNSICDDRIEELNRTKKKLEREIAKTID